MAKIEEDVANDLSGICQAIDGARNTLSHIAMTVEVIHYTGKGINKLPTDSTTL